MNDVLIRPATSNDMAAVHRLIVELAVYENEPDAVLNTVDSLIADGFGEDPKFKCLVAEQDKEVIGFALYYFSYSTWRGPCLYLEDLLVTERMLRKGVGKLLFDAVLHIATEYGAKRFEWQVLDWNEPAISFYKKYQTEFDETWINCKIFLNADD